MSNPAFQRIPGVASLSGIVVAQGAAAPVALKVNLTAVTNPGVTDDSAAGYSVGSLWINTTLDRVFIAADNTVGGAIWKESAASSSTSLTETITIANTFVPGDIVRRTAGGWTKSQANSAANAPVTGVVQSATGGSFVIVYSGKLTLTAHGFAIGAVLYLSPLSAGLLTVTQPVTIGQVSREVAVVLDANTLLITVHDLNLLAGQVTNIDASGGVQTTTGSPITATGIIRGAHTVNAQVGVTYAIVTGDRGRLITFNNASAVAVSLPTPDATFPDGWFTFVQNRGVGVATFSPIGATIDGAPSISLITGQGLMIVCDGTNYFTQRGKSGTTGSAFVSAQQTITAGAQLVLPHGLGGMPTLIQTRMICTSADMGYSVGDELIVPNHQARAGTDNGFVSIVPDAVNLTIRLGSDASFGYVLDKGTGAGNYINITKWKLIFRAWNQNLDPASVFSVPFTSAAQTITAGGLLTIAHGLSTTPNLFQLRLKNVNTELNWAVNDEVIINPGHINAGSNRGVAIYADATNIFIRYGSGAATFELFNKTTGASTNATNVNWNLIVKAWAPILAPTPGLPTGFTSTAQTITSNGTLTIAHSLGVKPRIVMARLKNTIAELGYTPGDEVQIHTTNDNGYNINAGISLRVNSTNLLIKFGNAGSMCYLVNLTTGGTGAITNANWQLILEAFA